MSYRIGEHKPRPRHRGVVAITSLSTIDVINGQIADMAYPAWYIEEHPPKKVNGKIKPKHQKCYHFDPDHHICLKTHNRHVCIEHCLHCKHYIDMDKVIPIHLHEEYPDDDDKELTLTVNLEHTSSGLILPGLSASAKVRDYPNDHEIIVTVNAECPSAQDEMKSCKFSLALNYNDPDEPVRSVLLNGKIRVWPAILNGGLYE